MQLGFVIDHSKCIGCHACTVACKAENDVPLGSFRTWVKYTEEGEFPTVRRSFAVLRCNRAVRPCIQELVDNYSHKMYRLSLTLAYLQQFAFEYPLTKRLVFVMRFVEQYGLTQQ